MALSRKAVHFGAGNIGRGFVAQLLHRSGYEVVFADVDDALVRQLESQHSYVVREIGDDPATTTVDGYRAVNTRKHEERAVAEVATADVVTTAVGPRILPFVAPLIARAIAVRDADREPLVVIACENSDRASDALRGFVANLVVDGDLRGTIFANCAIDRIVPEQDESLDVVVESYFEWTLERSGFEGEPPAIVGAEWVDDLTPYIERKLFTVKTAHAAAAYHGFVRGIDSIREALSDADVLAEVRGVLAETTSLLVAKHGFDEGRQELYIRKSLERIADPRLPDTTERVGRHPLRKLSRGEYLVAPAAALAERGMARGHLVGTIRAALSFDVPDDVESVELQAILRSITDDTVLVETLTGIGPHHPLFADLLQVMQLRTAGALSDRAVSA